MSTYTKEKGMALIHWLRVEFIFPKVRQEVDIVVLGAMRKEDKRGLRVIVMFCFLILELVTKDVQFMKIH